MLGKASRTSVFSGLVDHACRPASSAIQQRARSSDRPARWSALSQSCKSSNTRTKSAVFSSIRVACTTACPEVRGRQRVGRTRLLARNHPASSSRPRASDTAGSLTITLVGTPSPDRCARYSCDEKPLSSAICSTRTSVTVAPSSAAVSHCGVTPSMPDGTPAAVAPTSHQKSSSTPKRNLTRNN